MPGAKSQRALLCSGAFLLITVLMLPPQPLFGFHEMFLRDVCYSVA